jgi:hypothetical protein
MERTITLFLLSILLVSCTPTTSTTFPTAAVSPTAKALPNQAPTRTPIPTPEAAPTPLSGSDFTLERTVQTGGRISGITVVGDVAYVGMGPRVASIDISQPDKPQLIHQSEPLPGAVNQLVYIEKASASFLLVSAGKYVVLMEASHPDELESVQQLDLAGAISALVWDPQQDIVYIGGSIYQSPSNYSGYISAIELTSDHHLQLLNSTDMPERPLSLALGHECLYAGAEGYRGGLYYIQVKGQNVLSTPLLVIASTPLEPLQPLSMQVIGDRIYLSYKSIEAYDITHPNQPEKIWSVGGNVVQSFNLDREEIFAFGWTILSEFTQYRLSAPEPALGSPVGITGSVTAVHNGNFLVAYDNLEIYQPIDPDGLKLVGSFQSQVTNAIGMAINEAAIFVVDQGFGFGSTTGDLRVLNLPDLKQHVKISLEYPSWNWFSGMSLNNDRIYLATHDSLSVYGVSGVELTFLGHVEISGGGVEAIAVLPDPIRRLLVVAQQAAENSHLQVFDLTDLGNAEMVGDPLILEKGEIIQMQWSDSTLFALRCPVFQYESVMLDRITLNDTTLTLQESLLVPSYVVAMAIDSDFIALASSEALSIVSAKAAEPLILLTQVALPEVGIGVAFHKGSVLVAVGGEGGVAQLLAFDTQDPALPKQDNALDTPVSKLNQVPIMVSGPYIVLANGVGGVEVLRYEP